MIQGPSGPGVPLLVSAFDRQSTMEWRKPEWLRMVMDSGLRAVVGPRCDDDWSRVAPAAAGLPTCVADVAPVTLSDPSVGTVGPVRHGSGTAADCQDHVHAL